MTPHTKKTSEKLVYSIREASAATGLSRSTLYLEIRDGRLAVRKAGRRTIILDEDLRDWLSRLPEKR
jgi:excisionase family DNA binding protein